METKKIESKKEPNNQEKWAILFVLVMCPFMATLDSSIINVALPKMSDDLMVSSGMISWVVSSYLIVISAVILLFGRLGDLVGHIKVLQIGMLIFTLGSFLCGLSHSFVFLIFSRMVQAAGAAGIMANNQGIITRVFPSEERGRALGINAAFVALGTLVGPALGGFIISVASWEYLFWINVPIGLATSFAGLKLFPKTEELCKGSIDWVGTGLFVFTIVPLFIGLGQGQAIGFNNIFIIICFCVSILSFILFLHFQKKNRQPLLDLSIFRNKWFSISIFCSFTSFVAISFYNIILPFYLQDVLKFSPQTAGMFMTVYPLVLVMTAPVSGYLSDKIGSEVLTLLGLFLTGLGLGLISTLNDSPSYAQIQLYIAIMAAGNGLFQSPNNSLIMSSVPRSKLGVGGGVNALVRNIGYALGVSLATALLYSGISAKVGYHVTNYIEGQNGAFLFGMRISYLVAAGFCLIGFIVTAIRLIVRKSEKLRNNAA